MLGLELAMAVVVTLYFTWEPATHVISGYAAWQHSGGPFATALASALAGGVLSELTLVYIQNGGRWTLAHLESMGFKSAMFFMGGAIVYEFYQYQALWFGDGASWKIVLPKLLVDQFGFSIFWATPYQTLMTRWHANHYSGRKLWNEMTPDIVFERMLPILMTNWVFWFPCMALIYSTPLMLQPSLAVFGMASWSILLVTVARHEKASPENADLVLSELVE